MLPAVSRVIRLPYIAMAEIYRHGFLISWNTESIWCPVHPLRKKKITVEDNMEVVVVTGDGSSMVWDC